MDAGKAIQFSGGSYSWYNNQHYQADGTTNFGQYNANAAFITQKDYSG